MKAKKQSSCNGACEVEWKGKVDLPSRPVHVYLSLASSRTRVSSVAYGKCRSSEIKGGKLTILKLPNVSLDAKKGLRFEVVATGELPEVAALSIQEVDGAAEGDGGGPDARGVREVTGQVAAKFKALLDQRAAAAFADHSVERRFFLQFDAWTNASVAEWLVEPEHARFRAALSPAARKFFVDALPRPFGPKAFVFDDPAGLSHLAQKLYEIAITRGQALPDGRRHDPDLDSRDLVMPLLRPATSKKASLERVSTFLKAVFAPLHARRAPAPHGKLTRLEMAFALFASGHLNFVPVAERDAIKRQLNCEPDSGFFFCFAEFALCACKELPAEVAYWFPIARLFVALEDAFLEAYGPRLGPHRFEDYKREARWPELVPFDLVAKHVEWYRSEHPDSSSLAQLKLKHSANALHAAKDDVFKPKRSVAATG